MPRRGARRALRRLFISADTFFPFFFFFFFFFVFVFRADFCLPMDYVEPISYRQVGRRVAGHLHKGPAGRVRPESGRGVTRAGVQGRSSASLDSRAASSGTSSHSSVTRERTKASIPSRFETVLHHGATESDGFGSASQRFRYSDHETPGPGKYGAQTHTSTMVWNPEMKGSLSKKGYGGLVSKTNRFSNRAMLEAATLPGPGGSSKGPPKSMLFTRNDFSRGTTSANFAKPRRYRDEPKLDDDRMPGPGHYATPVPAGMAVSGCASGFRSKTNRFKKSNDMGVTGRVPVSFRNLLLSPRPHPTHPIPSLSMCSFRILFPTNIPHA